MDFNAIIKRLINLVTKTASEWDAIQAETITIKDMYLKFAIVVYAIPSVAILIGFIIGGAPIGMALGMAVAMYVITLGLVFLMGVLIDVLAPQFGASGKDMVASQKLAVFSLAPYGVLGVLFVLPIQAMFYLIMLASLFCFYVMMLGAPKLKGIASQDKVIPLIIILAVAWLILYYVDFRLSTRIALELFIGSVRARLGGL